MQTEFGSKFIISDKFALEITEFLINFFGTTEIPPLIIAFSGGGDSMSLLHCLEFSVKPRLNSLKVFAAHLNHGWRGEQSDNDEKACKDFCSKYNIEFYSEKLSSSVPKTETAARRERYKFFERAAEHFHSNIILTAHTKSDNAETLLYRIAKGTGVTGLCGISKVRKFSNIKILRPMLNLSAEEVKKYCIENDLKPNIDESNFDISYNRNFVRHEILPLLRKINSKAEDALSNLSVVANVNEEIVTEYLNQVRRDIFVYEKINTSKFLLLSTALKTRLIYDYIQTLREIKDFDYDCKKINEILDFIKTASLSKSGKTFSLSENLWLFVSKDYIYAINDAGAENLTEINIDRFSGEFFIDNLKFSICECSTIPYKFPKENENIAYVSFNDTSGLTLRYRRHGDVIQPFGMQNIIKLKKYFINKGIPQHKKDKVVLLCKNKEVLWAAGVGLSEKLRVTAKPTHVLRIEEV